MELRRGSRIESEEIWYEGSLLSVALQRGSIVNRASDLHGRNVPSPRRASGRKASSHPFASPAAPMFERRVTGLVVATGEGEGASTAAPLSPPHGGLFEGTKKVQTTFKYGPVVQCLVINITITLRRWRWILSNWTPDEPLLVCPPVPREQNNLGPQKN